jgi:hypothetical protein
MLATNQHGNGAHRMVCLFKQQTDVLSLRLKCAFR